MTIEELDRKLGVLKDFQRDTADHVFRRMYEDADPATRFLVADEVGLGKTLVAAGIVAKAVHHLEQKGVDRIDIVYICSNAGIARQNIRRLNVTGVRDHRLPDRITLLPRDIKSLKANKVNFISFTPATSFNLGSGEGRADERALLYWLLPEEWTANKAGSIAVLTGGVARDRFKGRVDSFMSQWGVDETLRDDFRNHLTEVDGKAPDASHTLRSRFMLLADQLGRRTHLEPDQRLERTTLVGAMRATLAATCIDSLEPDLVILDEFQRFRDLLRGQDEAAQLANQLFSHEDVRVLLLSATPYKMFTLSEETSGDDHYADFVETAAFLQRDPVRTAAFREALDGYRREIFRLGSDDGGALRSARESVTGHLKRVMVRTERLASTPDRNGMLREVPATTPLSAADVTSFLQLQRVARALDQSDVIEYWKSAPYLFNFMDEYQLKEQFVAATSTRAASVALNQALEGADSLWLSPTDVDAYRRLDPSNARLRALGADTLDRGLWQLLWIPPAMPYYRPAGVFQQVPSDLTKRLVFSSWQVVPKVVAGLLTYEAERRMLGVPDEGDPGAHSGDSRRTKGQRLNFSIGLERPVGMPALALLYPCLTLAQQIDPLRTAGISAPDSLPDIQSVFENTRTRCVELLQEVTGAASDGGSPDEAWYWAAPLLLDRHFHAGPTTHWFGQANLADHWRGLNVGLDDADGGTDAQTDRGWAEHVETARRLLSGRHPLGRPPDDLADVVAWMALAGPAVCALRALGRICGDPVRMSDISVRNAAGGVAEGLRSLFNQPDVTVMLRHRDGALTGDAEKETPYWRHVLAYTAEGCLQSVLDEYAHVLVESSGMLGKPWRERARVVADEITGALNLRTAAVPIDRIERDPITGQTRVGPKLNLRSRFAVRYGNRAQDEAHVNRATDLQRSFNSPFWPFVLCSTSVGQEGLDFHCYCHAVVHWNLPSNPVDLEQREGRVHRFKGHAVRKNVARRFGVQALEQAAGSPSDPWVRAFSLAKKDRDPDDSDLVPFWVYPIDGGSRIERHVPALPLSRDAARADQLRRSLAVYRMAFGQSRQEDLVAYLLGKTDSAALEAMSAELCVDLSPDRSPHRTAVALTDVELVTDEFKEAGAPVEAPAISLHALERLLDDFAKTRPAPPIRATSEMVATLLDEFSKAWMQSDQGEAR